MTEVTILKSWREDLASLAEETETVYSDDLISPPAADFEIKNSKFIVSESVEAGSLESESFADQVKGFGKAWGEIMIELSRGCMDVVQQSLLTEDSYVVQKMRGPCEKVSGSFRFLNDYLPEDRDPIHAWPVIFFVFLVSLTVLCVNHKHQTAVRLVNIHPPSATRILLPDGRYLAYRELGVPAEIARFSLIAPHSFLSSRLAGIPGVKVPMLEEFGVRLVTYDLPGFGESDPNPNRNLNASAFDMLYLAKSIAISGKFWVLGYSSGAMHAFAALKYIPDKIAGAAMLAPMINPYQSGMTKEEVSRIWQKWTRRRKLMFYLARRFPIFLSHFYRRSFLSGKHDRINKWLSLSLGQKDELLIEEEKYKDFSERDVEESIRQRSNKPFIEEAVLQVSDWGFSPADLQPQKKCSKSGIFSWLNSFLYTQPECEVTGFLGPIHIWQGMDDEIVPASMSDYLGRVIPSAAVHKLPQEGHLSYFFFCDKCHRDMFSTLFGNPQGSLQILNQQDEE
jgi:pimeloyl-ACP methyl ester carboxylesterase